MSCQTSLFGPSSQFIKTNGGDITAVEGANTRERIVLSDLRIPYKQILKSRIILRAGQVSYLLNHLGLGDNATFLCIRSTFNPKSVIEADNYISWSYYGDWTRVNFLCQLMILTGNSSNRVPQISLTNPNTKYPVLLDVMVAVIDDNYSFFADTLNQSGSSFTGLEYSDIKTHVIGESIVILDKSSPAVPLIYLTLVNIQVIEKTGNVLILDDNSVGRIFLQFLTDYDANQSQSLLNYVMENPLVNIYTLTPVADSTPPAVYFYSKVGGTGDYISLNGVTASVPYNTSSGPTFSTSISLTTFGSSSVISDTSLLGLLVDHSEDNRDGLISMSNSNFIITGGSGVVTSINITGTYSVTFDFADIAQNYVNNTIILNIVS